MKTSKNEYPRSYDFTGVATITAELRKRSAGGGGMQSLCFRHFSDALQGPDGKNMKFSVTVINPSQCEMKMVNTRTGEQVKD